jgi:hypothetical protein
MKPEDLLTCPLLQGLDATRRSELLGLLDGSGLREKVEACVAHKANSVDITPVRYSNTEGKGPQDEKKVHKWTPATPMSRRCLDE